MLRSFQVTNHRFLAEPQELRPIGTRAGALPAPVTAVRGAVATGKSSLVDALAHMRDAVLHSVAGWDPYAGPVRAPHLGFVDRPSEFAAAFVAEGVSYSYGYRLDQADVTAEWLYSHPHQRKRVVFERAGEQIRVGAQFEPARYGIGALVPLVRPNALLLSLAGQLHAEALTPAHRWFADRLDVVHGPGDPAAIEHRLGSHLSRSAEHAARLLTLLRGADLGVEDVLIPEPDPRYADYLRELDGEIAVATKEADACLISPGHAAELAHSHGLTPAALDRELADLRAARDTLYTRMAARCGVGLGLVHTGMTAAIDVADESTATLALLRLLPAVLDALDIGRVLVVDDLDTQLTPGVAARLTAMFTDPDTNPRGAQLIYTGRGEPAAARHTSGWELRRTPLGVGELTAC
ncbi:AAA family ATPase [Nocardia sp. alder85J]|uniref:AAA family ATPase n=1 Tax=Nocardia sp. alder85J TaxID=2862949 RepID=UPI001CD3A2D4|nr:AAA family ATPase [Nocardia sp. alder85J]MCX4093911.1 AAA family ATPase [Nocardia sp. alder85J]